MDNTEQKPLTLQECKEQIAKKFGHACWDSLRHAHGMGFGLWESYSDKAAELHASQQTEALQLENAHLKLELYQTEADKEALQAEVERLKEDYKRLNIEADRRLTVLMEKDRKWSLGADRISQLEEALRELLHNSVNNKGFPQIATAIQLRKAQKALHP
jgi:predicted RNase H-like nuclease (RuvC/YqgF family)